MEIKIETTEKIIKIKDLKVGDLFNLPIPIGACSSALWFRRVEGFVETEKFGRYIMYSSAKNGITFYMFETDFGILFENDLHFIKVDDTPIIKYILEKGE